MLDPAPASLSGICWRFFWSRSGNVTTLLSCDGFEKPLFGLSKPLRCRGNADRLIGMEDTVDLKVAPCPFCGVEAQKLQHSEGLWKFSHVESCYFAQVDFGRSFHILDVDQVASWNARVAPEFICDRCYLRQDAKPAVKDQEWLF
jgi:hypothetical protein